MMKTPPAKVEIAVDDAIEATMVVFQKNKPKGLEMSDAKPDPITAFSLWFWSHLKDRATEMAHAVIDEATGTKRN